MPDKLDAKVKRALLENLTVPPEIAGKAFGLGRSSAYQAVRAGTIPSIRVGRLLKCPTAPLRQMLGIADAKPSR
jgi:hypothetical protein